MLLNNSDIGPLRQQTQEFDQRVASLEQDVQQYLALPEKTTQQIKKTAKPSPDVFRMDYPEDADLKNARANGSTEEQRETADPIKS
eukprot:7348940-Lingulodinium_polyedra.AAC.1